MNVLTTEGHVQANGRLQRWNSKGLQEGLVKAAARDSEHSRGLNGFQGFKKAYSRAWWKVPPGIRSILSIFLKVLRVLSV